MSHRHELYASPVIALAAGDTYTLDASTIGRQVDSGLLNWFAALEFYTDSTGATPATPTAGTLVFTVKTDQLPNSFQTISASPIDLGVLNESVDWVGNVVEIKVSGLTGVSGGSATHFQLRATGNL